MKGKNKSIQPRQTKPLMVTQAVPQGYKCTEVGVIPEDWEVDRIDHHASIKTGAKNTQDRIEDGEYPFFVRSQQVERINSYSYEGEAVLTAGDGVGTGKVFHYIDGRFDVHQRVYQISDFSPRLSGRYFYYQFSSRFYDRIMSMTAKSSVDSVRMEMIAGMKIPLPPPAEQRTIAKALSDVDGLIEALDKLVAKKRAIKQATMQQLLTGKTRLPGFSGEWGTRRLGEMLVYERPDRYIVQDTDYKPQGQVPVLTANKSLILGYTNENFGVCKDIPVIVFDDFTTESKYVDFPFKVKSSAIKLLRPRHAQVDLRFFFELMQIIRFPIGDHKRYYIAEYQHIQLPIPDFGEQRAIAQILSDMDAEIDALERRREKVKQIKQGMMQQLLTGRIRLVEPQASAARTDEQLQETKGHSWAFNEAVVISVLVKYFGSKRHPLGRKRYTKLSYLLHRYVEKNVEGYLKKAAGPYNPRTKYGGPEKIALEKGYIREHKRGAYSGFVAADNIAEAEGYFNKWYGLENLRWLEQFRFKTNDELELLTTVDMAVEELRASGKNVDVKGVKGVIRSYQEWKAKLDRPVFSDANIAKAIKMLRKIFEASKE